MEDHAYREQFELEDEHWWFRGRRAVMWSLLARAQISGPLRLLDAGCGTGRNLVEFGSLGEVQGVDSSPEALELCRRRGVGNVAIGAVEALPFTDASFDLVLATDVLEHLESDRAGLHELRRVAAPDGRLLVTVPAYRWLWSQHDDAHHHYRRYTARQLRAAAADSGWEPLIWSYFNSTLLPPIALVRLLARRTPADADGRPDLRLTPGILNRILEQPLRYEAWLIRQGIHLPAGVSIGMICEAR